jgi:hypothetical protein
MRLAVLVALLFAVFAAHGADENPFSGAWVGWICPAGAQADPMRCSNLVLQLQQKDGKVCGAHVFATAGAAQLDEGAAPSLTGSVANGVAAVTVESARTSPPVKIRVEMQMARGGLQWRRLDSPEGDYLLPLSARLSKSKYGSLLHPVFAQKLDASCAAIFSAPPRQAAAPAPVSTITPGPAPVSQPLIPYEGR